MRPRNSSRVMPSLLKGPSANASEVSKMSASLLTHPASFSQLTSQHEIPPTTRPAPLSPNSARRIPTFSSAVKPLLPPRMPSVHRFACANPVCPAHGACLGTSELCTHTRVPLQRGSMLDFTCKCHHLENLNHLIFELVFYT